MQPNNENIPDNNFNNTNTPNFAPQPQMATQPQQQPMTQQPQYAPQQQMYKQQSSFVGDYISTLKTLFANPRGYFTSPPADFTKSLIFPGINLGIMIVVMFLATIFRALINGQGLSGSLFGSLLKNIGLSSLYVMIFLAAMSGIIMVFALVAKKNTTYKDIFAMTSIFSLNFLAIALGSIIMLITASSYDVDFLSFMYMINNLVVSTVFVYVMVLLIQGITSVTQFNMFKSTAIFIVSAILITFMFSKIIKTSVSDMGLSFGGYSNSMNLTSANNSDVEVPLYNIESLRF